MRRLRNELLRFTNLTEARQIIEAWMIDDNTNRTCALTGSHQPSLQPAPDRS
jgi:hypothetical protein